MTISTVDHVESTVQLVGVARMAAQLNISDRGLRRLVAADRIPYYRVGRELRFNPAEVLRALRSQAGGDGNAA